MLSMTDDSCSSARMPSMPPIPPLFCNVPPPRTYATHHTVNCNKFLDAKVLYPRHVEVSRLGDLENGVLTRITAPQPSDVHSINQQAFSAFLACNGVIHIHPANMQHLSADTVAAAEKAELSHAALTTASQRVPSAATATAIAAAAACGASASNEPNATALTAAAALATGPNHSQRSRSVAITLLLPNTTSSPRLANRKERVFLDALATLAQLPAKRTKSFVQVPRAWPSSQDNGEIHELTCANCVRLSVVCGIQDCAAYINASKASVGATTWKSSVAVVVTYYQHGSLVPCYAQIPESSFRFPDTPTLEEAIRSIQKAVAAVQTQSSSCMTLPQAFLNDVTNFASGVDAACLAALQGFGDSNNSALSSATSFSEADDGAVWLAMQANLSQRFKNLLLCPVHKELSLSKATINKLGIGSPSNVASPFCRFTSNQRRWCDDDSYHGIGILYSTNKEVLQSYLLRCRNHEPHPINPHGEWPKFVLQAPNAEEATVALTALCFSYEQAHIGGDLCLFFPRPISKMGENVTEFKESHASRVVPSLVAIEQLVQFNFVVPVNASSVQVPKPTQPGVADLSRVLNHNFGRFVSDTTESLRPCIDAELANIEHDTGGGGEVAQTSLLLPDDRNPADDARSEAMSAILGSRVGHPISTVGRAYSVLEQHGAEACLDGGAFHKVLTSALNCKLFGSDAPLDNLFDTCAALLPIRELATHKFKDLVGDGGGETTIEELLIQCIEKFDTSVSLSEATTLPTDDAAATAAAAVAACPNSPKKRARTPEMLEFSLDGPPPSSTESLNFLLHRKSNLLSLLGAKKNGSTVTTTLPFVQASLSSLFKLAWVALKLKNTDDVFQNLNKKIWFSNFKTAYRACRTGASTSDDNSDDKEKVEIKSGVVGVPRCVGGAFASVLAFNEQSATTTAKFEDVVVFVVDEVYEEAVPDDSDSEEDEIPKTKPAGSASHTISKITLNRQGSVTLYCPRTTLASLMASSETNDKNKKTKTLLMWSTTKAAKTEVEAFAL